MAVKSTKRGKGKASSKPRPRNLPTRKAADVKGGALNAYLSTVVGEKQGSR